MFWDSQTSSTTHTSHTQTRNIQQYCMMEECFYEDKENARGTFDSESSIYDTSLTESSPEATTTAILLPPARRTLDLTDHDNNSQDSGYSAMSSNRSPRSSRTSFGSILSTDEMMFDTTELEKEQEQSLFTLPDNFNKLITGHLVHKEEKKECDTVVVRPTFRRALSMITPNSNSNHTPTSSRVRSSLFKSNDDVRSFKRPEPPSELQSPIKNKRSRRVAMLLQNIPARPFGRQMSATEDSIKSALDLSTETALIGDFSKSFSLPIIPGRHQDLKSITPETLAGLMNGTFIEEIASFQVIDCRYPYEFEGGHIAGAQNLYTKEQIIDELLNIQIKNGRLGCEQRHIIVFHCEFSSERGPNLSRYLRNMDRSYNKDFYPQLYFPEVYLLDGGYKNFYEQHPELCVPEGGYLPMLHPDYEQSLRHFRAKARTWNSDVKSKSNLRSSSFKRL